jgi:hypothetical protein
MPCVQNAKSGCVKIQLQGRVFPSNVVAIPYSKNEWTLLGVDFIGKAGIIIDMSRSEYVSFLQPLKEPFCL